MKAARALVILGVVSVLSAAPAVATEVAPRTISTSGEADVKVVPDEVTLTLGVETSDKDLEIAKSQNDASVKKILAVAKDAGIDPRQLKTDYLSLEPRYESRNNERLFLGYWVRKTLTITLQGRLEVRGRPRPFARGGGELRPRRRLPHHGAEKAPGPGAQPRDPGGAGEGDRSRGRARPEGREAAVDPRGRVGLVLGLRVRVGLPLGQLRSRRTSSRTPAASSSSAEGRPRARPDRRPRQRQRDVRARMMSDKPKSAFELAMERLKAEDKEAGTKKELR